MNSVHSIAKTAKVTTVVLAFLAFFAGSAFSAENSIKQIQVRRDGDQVLLKIQMAAPLKSLPGNWSVVEPPRVVFDFPETDNQTGQNSQQVAAGDLKSLNVVQTEKLTRLVLNLFRPTKFSTEIVGDVLFVKLEAQTAAAGQESTPSVYQTTTAKSVDAAAQAADAELATVRDISFRRGEDGQAFITVDLTDGSVPIDVRRTGAGLTVELGGVALPERLQNRRDVLDFATPVSTISSQGKRGMTQLDIVAKGRWFHQAHLANNQLTIEVKPIPADEANKLVQTGQQGQKVSINFFNADATMVLRTLAEISGKNVLIDPSLTGKTVTANLENIPYDQALEIIMTQVNAGMRMRNEVVLFGDRVVLQKRDQDLSDELSRSNDTAPLISETFKLSYIKPSELAVLIRANIAQAAAPAAAAAAPAAAAAAPAAAAAAQQQGMLSSRGRISTHDQTKKFFITDISSVIESVRAIIREVDVPLRQVVVEARIVVATQTFNSDFGMRMRLFDNQQSPGGGRSAFNGGLRYGFGSGVTAANVNLYGAPAASALTVSNAVWTAGNGGNLSNALVSSGATLNLFNAAASRILQLELAAAEIDTKTRTISSPRVIAQDGKAASMTQTLEDVIVTQTTTGTGTTTISRKLGITVTPTIAPDGRVALDLTINKDDPRGTQGSLKNEAKTMVMVENGGTVVIGGIYSEDNTDTVDRIPFFGDLPYVGFLFKSTQKRTSKTELLVFITPRVLDEKIVLR
jgi:type IV pilus assembly protein PilQ